MKAVIKMVDDNNTVEVVGEDLTIFVNVISSLLEVIDRSASDRVIFSAYKADVKCAYIWNCEDIPVREVKNDK